MSVQQVPLHPTANAAAPGVQASNGSKDKMTAPSKWLLPDKQHIVVNSSAIKLFCVPQAGMGAWVYQAWSERLAPHIQVFPVELPGHGSRMKEQRLTSLRDLSVCAVDALEPHLREGAYALFGHSMGAWFVWEMLQEITRRGLPLPVRLFVSGNRAPSQHGVQHDVDPVRMHKLPPQEFWPHFRQRYGENKHLADPAMQAFMYPMLRDDFELVETYEPSSPGAKTSVALVAIGGALDVRYSHDQVSAWSQHTMSKFTEVWLDNQGHNYIADCPHGLIAMLRMELGPMSVQRLQTPSSAHPSATAAAVDGRASDSSQAAKAGSANNMAAERPPPPGFWHRCCCGS